MLARQLSALPRRSLSSLQYSREVKQALVNRVPVVALESTIITHGMPFPDNLATAAQVEQIVRNAGAVPATVAVHKGQIHVGLSAAMLEEIASSKEPKVKISRRDLAAATAQGLTGGTTVAGTMIIANKAGIDIFVTGGIGGVHRGAEISMDVSADLIELGRTPVTVVSAGVKSILDIEKTLEYLETQGVCVATYGDSRDFPSFFTRKSQFKAPWNVRNPHEAAEMIASQKALKLQSGILIANPIPAEHEADGEIIEKFIQQALNEVSVQGIKGKDVTPYILSRIHETTKGLSLQSNIALVKHNALVGSQIAKELSEKLNKEKPNTETPHIINSNLNANNSGRPVVIGGSAVDFNIKIEGESFVKEIETNKGKVFQSYGGVARNIADCLARLGVNPLLVSIVGDDYNGRNLLTHCTHIDQRGIAVLPDATTAVFCGVHSGSGQLFYNIGDMDIFSQMTKEYVLNFENDIISSSIVVLDGNLPEETFLSVLDLCARLNKPVWFEPTSNNCSTMPFNENRQSSVWFTSPNSGELEIMYKRLIDENEIQEENLILKTAKLAKALLSSGYILHTVYASLGEKGLIRVRKDGKSYNALHFEAPRAVSIKTANGAGDCQASAIISGISLGFPEEKYMGAAMNIPLIALNSYSAVPKRLSPRDLKISHDVKTNQIPL